MNEDCLLLTVDDHLLYPKRMLKDMMEYYHDSGHGSGGEKGEKNGYLCWIASMVSDTLRQC